MFTIYSFTDQIGVIYFCMNENKQFLKSDNFLFEILERLITRDNVEFVTNSYLESYALNNVQCKEIIKFDKIEDMKNLKETNPEVFI